MKNRVGVAEWLLEAFGSWEARLRGHWALPQRRLQSTGVFCFGQSHTISLRRAWKRGLYRPADPALHFTFLLANDRRLGGSRIASQSPTTGEVVIGPELER